MLIQPRLRTTVQSRPKTEYIVWLREVGLWLCLPNKWVERKDHASRFLTFKEADEASAGYDVIIKTVEE